MQLRRERLQPKLWQTCMELSGMCQQPLLDEFLAGLLAFEVSLEKISDNGISSLHSREQTNQFC